MRFRMAGGDKKFQPPFFCPPFNLAEKTSILTEVVGEDKKMLTIFSSLTKIL